MPELDYKLTEAKAETVDGERSQAAIVNQPAKENLTNTITVEEVKGFVFDSPKRHHTNNIQKLPGDLLDVLECGDIVVKHTNELKHTYIVTHKQETGICLSYFNAGYSETVSYDKVEGVWTYNSTDVWNSEE